MASEETRMNQQYIKKRVLRELKEFRDKPLPEPQEDWDLIWVLSGGELLEEVPTASRNESRDRLMTGFRLAKTVTGIRLDKEPDAITIENMITNGPKLYINGRNEQNEDLRCACSNGILEEKYKFPKESVEIAPTGSNITNTTDQFERFPPGLLVHIRKIVIVSSARHLPRVRRYLGLQNNPFSEITQDRLILYPATPVKFPLKDTLKEIRKIPIYEDKGFLPPEKE